MKAAVWVHRIPWWIPLGVAGLMGLGLLGLARCEDFGDGGRHYLRQQILWAFLGMMVMLAAAVPNYRRLCHWSYAIFALSMVLLLAVYLFRSVNGRIAGCDGDTSACNRRSLPRWPSFSSWADT